MYRLRYDDIYLLASSTPRVNYAGEEPADAPKPSILLASIYGSFLYLHNWQPVIKTK
jgi:hypothetical protein